jgi:hypothetical protein
MDRRSFLAALAAGLAGCGTDDRSAPPESTVTPLDVPEAAPRADGQLSVDESRFGAGTPAPGDVRPFHRLEPDYGVGLVPNRERFSPAAPSAPIRLRNRRSEPLWVPSGWSLRKYTGHRWVRIPGSPLDRGGIRLDPGESWRRRHRIRRVFDLPVLGPGLYARTREVRLADDTVGGEAVAVGFLFEVEGTDYEVTATRNAKRDRDTARLSTSDYVDGTAVFERVDADPASAASLVPEAVGAVPPFREGIPLLKSVETVRVSTASTSLTYELLARSTVREVAVGPETPLELRGTVFAVRVEET